MSDNNDTLKTAWDNAVKHAFMFADCVVGTNLTSGHARIVDMDVNDVQTLTSRIIAEGQDNPDVLRHSIESLITLWKKSEMSSKIDALTEIYNKSFFNEAVERHLEHVRRGEEQNGAIINIDLDGFKPINDIYGHAAGDKALQEVGSTLRREMRKTDISARMGGDEFAILLTKANSTQAGQTLERLTNVFSSLSFEWNGKQLPIRASLGLALIDNGQSYEEVLAAADRAMYESKQSKGAARHTAIQSVPPAAATLALR